MSIFISILNGDNDAILTWPYNGRLLFTLLDQSEARNNHNIIFEPETMKSENKVNCLRKPDIGGNPSIGFFIS